MPEHPDAIAEHGDEIGRDVTCQRESIGVQDLEQVTVWASL